MEKSHFNDRDGLGLSHGSNAYSRGRRNERVKQARWHWAVRFALAWLGLGVAAQPAAAEDRSQSAQSTTRESVPWKGYDELRVALLAGLIQPLVLQGGNVEVDLYYKRLSLGYSHGFLLNLRDSAVTGEPAEHGLSFFLPYSTGLGVGYRFLSWLDVRIEGKVHRFEVRQGKRSKETFSYTTMTLGLGVYAQYRPFVDFGVNGPEWAQGFLLVGSVRYWPNLWTSLPNGRRTYDNEKSKREEVHSSMNIGIANTPFIVNLGLGYMLSF